MTIKQVLLVIVALVATSESLAVDINNRYLPWYNQPFGRTVDVRSHVHGEIFFMTADKAFARSSDETKGIPELWGKYDQRITNDALLRRGIATPLLPMTGWWQTQTKIQWDVDQKIESQGFAFDGEWYLGKGISVGGSLAMMRVNCNLTFEIPYVTRTDMNLTAEQEDQLDSMRREMNKLSGITGTQWSGSGLSDTTLYFRWGNVWDYKLKSRQVDAGVRAGLYLPSGLKRNQDNPASIPFGSNGLYGFFVGADAAFEIKEDITVGMTMQISSHFKRTQERRLPSYKNENYLFGITKGDVRVNPGTTFVWNPFLRFGDLNDGWGAHVGYTLTHHTGDVWTDVRKDKTIAIDLNNIFSLSEWTTEYLSLYVSYDPSKVTYKDKVQPIITINWDAPIRMLAAKEAPKTHKIGLGVAIDF